MLYLRDQFTEPSDEATESEQWQKSQQPGGLV